MSIGEQAAGICADLIRRRLVPRNELVELGDDALLREEVSQRLSAVGLVLLERPGVPYFGVALNAAYRDSEQFADYGLDSRALGLLLHLWLRLVAKFIYGEQPMPEDYTQETVALDTLAAELPGEWKPSTLERYITRLAKRDWIIKVRGAEAVSAGPMLWLAIHHDTLLQYLREKKGIVKAVERYLREEREPKE
ncbi:MAG: hypothetical protein JXA21_04715 [Anaerolineae bacterium]|nr:hypothetical protein [Anaerolineae bacterium]